MAKGGKRTFGLRGTQRKMLGLSIEDISKITGYSVSTIKKLDSDNYGDLEPKKFVYGLYDELINALDEDARNKFNALVNAFMEVDVYSFCMERRICSTTAFRMALGLTQRDVELGAKLSQAQLSKIEQNKVSADDIRERIDDYLTKVYSDLPEEEQRKVENREAAIRIVCCPRKNPFRIMLKDILESKFSQDQLRPKPKENFEKEYTKELETENDELKKKIKELENELIAEHEKVSRLEDERDKLRDIRNSLGRRSKDLEEEIEKLKNKPTELEVVKDDSGRFIFNNCTVTIINGGNE